MLGSVQDSILTILYEAYPKLTIRKEIYAKIPDIEHQKIIRDLEYLTDKGLITKTMIPEDTLSNRLLGFVKQVSAYRLTAETIDQLEAARGVSAVREARGVGGGQASATVEVGHPPTSTQPVVAREERPVVEERAILDEVQKMKEDMMRFHEEMQKEERDFQRMFLGRIVEIFGIFIAIFTIVIITVNVTTNVSADTPFWSLIDYTFAMYLAPVIALIVLLIVVFVIVHR